jgi:hypothetical protein
MHPSRPCRPEIAKMRHPSLVRCVIPLYLAPGWDLREGTQVDDARLRELGAAARARCLVAADAVAALTRRGWRCHAGRIEVIAEKTCDRATAMLDFLDAGLDPVTLELHAVPAVSRPA